MLKWNKELKSFKEMLNKKIQELQVIMSTNYPHHQDYIDAMKEQTDKLWLTRKQLQTTTEQYYQIMRYHSSRILRRGLERFKITWLSRE